MDVVSIELLFIFILSPKNVSASFILFFYFTILSVIVAVGRFACLRTRV